MYPQYQQQQQQQQQQMSARSARWNDADMANHILNELKRMAGEYATAATEAANADVRQLFERLLQRTLSDQWQLFQQMNRLNMYGQPIQAHANDLHQEAQQHRKKRQELQSLIPQGAFRQPISGQQGQAQFGGMASEHAYGAPQTPVYTGAGMGAPLSTASGNISSGIAASTGHSGMIGGYTSTAGDGVYGNVGIASTMDAYGSSEMEDTSNRSESTAVHMTGSQRTSGHTTGSTQSRYQTHTGSNYIG